MNNLIIFSENKRGEQRKVGRPVIITSFMTCIKSKVKSQKYLESRSMLRKGGVRKVGQLSAKSGL